MNTTWNTYTYSSFQMTWNTNTQEQLQISATTEQEVSNLFLQQAQAMPSSLNSYQWEANSIQSYIQMMQDMNQSKTVG